TRWPDTTLAAICCRVSRSMALIWLVDRLQSPRRLVLGLDVDPLPRGPVQIEQVAPTVLHRQNALDAAVRQQELGVRHPTSVLRQVHRLARKPLDIVVVRLGHARLKWWSWRCAAHRVCPNQAG